MMPGRFDFISTRLAGLTVIRRKPLKDERGFFERLFCMEELCEAGLRKPIVQINRSLTRRDGTVRGMHFQYPPYAETKIVSCLRGEIFDVAVDIRQDSQTFLRWHGEVLSAGNNRSLLIPEGFAHGFQALTRDCEILYLVTAPYASTFEGGIHPEDKIVSVQWPLVISQMSEKDASQPCLGQDFAGIFP
ncbi:MAG: dTDP-4-dehydrorhamnose 3,5-epimerase [Desulfomonilaceae bacterium]